MTRNEIIEIMNNKDLTDEERSLHYRIVEKNDVIKFWNEKKNVADYYIKARQNEIDKLKTKLTVLELKK